MFKLKLLIFVWIIFSSCKENTGGELVEPPDGDEEEYFTLRVMTYNIYHGETNKRDGVINMDLYGQIIKDLSPDLVALQEVDKGTERAGGLDLTAELSKRTGLDGYFCKFFDFQGGEYGNAILSKFPVVDMDIRLGYRMQSRGVSFPFAKIQIDDDTFIYFNSSHLSTTLEERIVHTKQLTDYYVKNLDRAPLLILGDLNAEPDSEEMEVLLEEFSMADTTLSNTFSARTNLIKKIDFILYPSNENWEVVDFKRICRIDASDHCALFAVLRFKKNK